MAHCERHNAMDMWIGIAESVALANAVLPAMFSNLPFHCGILEATASTRLCSTLFLSLKIDSGIPR